MTSRYTSRPQSLEQVTLADIALSYDNPTQSKTPGSIEEDEFTEDQPTHDQRINDDDETMAGVTKGSSQREQVSPKCRISRILRSVRYEDTQPKEFSRERIMLYTTLTL